jgi:alkaline phosphatase D
MYLPRLAGNRYGRSVRRRTAAAVIVGVSLGLVMPGVSQAGSARFQYGVSASEVTSSSAILWSRPGRAGRATLEVATTPTFRACAGGFTGSAKGLRGCIRLSRTVRASDDYTAQLRVLGLRPGTRYYYRWRQGGARSETGRLRTAPSAGADRTIRFSYSGDADAQRAPGQTQPFYNNFEVYREMAQEGNDFNLNFGDTIYSDTEVPGAGPPALSVAAKWSKYKQNHAMANLRLLKRSAPILYHWDDHEFINDFTIPENGQALYDRSVRAYLDYEPTTYSDARGIYRSFRWGRNVEVFMLDQISFRSAKADDGGACDNPPGSGSPDLAPTAPQATRNLFAVVVPALANPVSQECLDRINDPNRTMLGRRQYDAFTRAVERSTATWKIIMNEKPIQQFYALPYDRWEGYAAERLRLIRDLRDNVDNVIFLTTDTHANFINDVRFRTLEPGGPLNSGIQEVITGPVATMTFSREIDSAVGQPGAGELITGLFFKPQPPGGVGMSCAQPDVYSYAQVTATRTRLTVAPRDLAGRPVRESDPDAPCGPVVLSAK